MEKSINEKNITIHLSFEASDPEILASLTSALRIVVSSLAPEKQ